jgi:hypothetical protein
MSRVEQHMLKHSTTVDTNNQIAITNGTAPATTVTTLAKRSTKSLKRSSYTANQGIFSVDSMSELQPIDDVDAAVLQSIVDDSRDTDSTVTASMHESSQSASNMSADSLDTSTNNNTGYGRALDSIALDTLPNALADLQVNPADITKVHEHYIGRGAFAKVYKVNYSNKICAAKVCISSH